MKTTLRILILSFFIGSASFASAQMDILAGLGLSFGSEASTVGIQVRGDVDFNETWGGSFHFISYISPSFGGDVSGIDGIKAKYWEVNFDAHYFVISEENMKVYPLAGLNISTAGFKSDLNIPFGGSFGATESKVGLNLGGGIRYAIAAPIWLFGEVKYVISDFDQLVISAGGLYNF